MAPSSITSSYTNVVGRSPSETGSGGGREISYGRFTFKGGKVFNPKTGMEIPKSKAGLSIGEMGALEESRIDLPSQFSSGGGGKGMFTDQTRGSRLGGMGVNISGGSGGGGSITNPYIRAESDLIDYLNWKYGSDIREDAPSRISGAMQKYDERISQLMKSGGIKGGSLTEEQATKAYQRESEAAQRARNWETVQQGAPGAGMILMRAMAQEDPNSAAYKQYSQMFSNLPKQRVF